jgi:hypothetical protein
VLDLIPLYGHEKSNVQAFKHHGDNSYKYALPIADIDLERVMGWNAFNIPDGVDFK